MPITAQYLDGEPINVRAWGVVTTDDLVDVVRDAHPHVTRTCPPLLVDARDVQSAPDLAEMRSILTEARNIPGIDKCRIALVTHSDWVFGIGRAISAYASFVGLAFEVFRDELAARSWLNASA